MNVLNLKKPPLKAKHLGLPNLISRSKNLAVQDLKQKLFQKIAGWKVKLLS